MHEPNHPSGRPSPLAAQVGAFGTSLRTVARTFAEQAGSVTSGFWLPPSTPHPQRPAAETEDSVRLVRPWMVNDSFRFVARQAASTQPDTTRSVSGRLAGRFDRSRSAEAGFGVELEPTEGTRLVPPSARIAEDLEQGSEEGGGSPPLLQWIVPALLCALAYASYNIFIKKGSATINPILGGVILQFVAALLGSCLLASLMMGGDETFKLHYDEEGVFWSITAGVAVGVAEMLSFVVSGLGVPATHSIPILIGGSVLFGAVLGSIVLGERLMVQGWFGVALLVTGIACVARDPGENVEEGGSSPIAERSPPAYWISIALACALAYALFNIFIKKGSASINPILGGVVLQFVAALFGTLLLGGIIMRDGGESLEYDHAGFVWACMAGVAVGMAELLSFCVSGTGVNATKSIPIIIGGSVLFGAFIGLLVLGELMMWPGWLGVALLTAGIGYVAVDPGQKGEAN